MTLTEARYKGYSLVGRFATLLGYGNISPVFIIGTGRCGTTLLVRILRSHAQLVGFPTEGNELWHPRSYPFSSRSIDTPPIVMDAREFTDASVRNWPKGQRQRIFTSLAGYQLLKGPGKAMFVKSAMLSFMIPQLSSIFPSARYIHIYRNGPAVVTSFMKKEWAKYCDSFKSETDFRIYCAIYWRDCLLEIEKQKSELALSRNGSFLEFSYEQLCDSPSQVQNDIARFLSIAPGGFRFDFSSIASQNYKAGDYTQSADWAEALDAMYPGMKLKGYVA